MAKPAAIRGTFADLKIIKTRKLAQFIIEIPIEKADEALRALGGIPMSDQERWVAIARIKGEDEFDPSKVGPEEKPKSVGERALAQAHVLCADEEFQDWFRTKCVEDRPIVVRDHFLKAWTDGDYNEAIAVLLRWKLGIDSRSELLTDETASNKLAEIVLEFDWRRGRAAEKRRG